MICNFFIGPQAETIWPWPGLQLDPLVQNGPLLKYLGCQFLLIPFSHKDQLGGLCSPFLMLGLGVVLIVIGLFMGWGLIDPLLGLGCCWPIFQDGGC